MQEKIGNVTLDYTYYPGEDLYSDGPVEEELLEIAKHYREEELNAVIARETQLACSLSFFSYKKKHSGMASHNKKSEVLGMASGCGRHRMLLQRSPVLLPALSFQFWEIP